MSKTTKCETKNRIVVHVGDSPPKSVCPKPPPEMRHDVVEVFSDGWAVSGSSIFPTPGEDPVRTIAIEFIIKEPDSYTVTWLELTRR